MALPRLRLQILLRKEWRTPEGVAAVRKALQAIDAQATGSGAATVSAVMEADAFERRFGPVPSVARLETDTLEVPRPLRPYVESISVAPRHTYMRKRAKRSKA